MLNDIPSFDQWPASVCGWPQVSTDCHLLGRVVERSMASGSWSVSPARHSLSNGAELPNNDIWRAHQRAVRTLRVWPSNSSIAATKAKISTKEIILRLQFEKYFDEWKNITRLKMRNLLVKFRGSWTTSNLWIRDVLFQNCSRFWF